MGIDMGSSAGGFQLLQDQIDALDANAVDATFTTLTVTGATDLQGTVVASGLPTADPTNADELWNDSNSASISAG